MRLAHRPRPFAVLLAFTVGVTLLIVPIMPAEAATSVGWKLVAAGNLGRPVQVTSPHDGTGRLFLVSLGGKVRIFQNGSVRSRPFLNIHDRVLRGYDEGLLSIAFHPQWTTHPYFWVAYINRAGNLRVAQFHASSYQANHVDADTGRRVLTVRYVVLGNNHYGGQLGFGNDGMLYLSTGDGGGNGDPLGKAQDKRSLRGKILRFRVIGAQSSCGRVYCVPRGNPFAGSTPGKGLIWALGLRNPWRFSVDPKTGNLWIGDVGEHSREEVDRIKAGDPKENLGWSCREADAIFNASRCRSDARYHGPRFSYGRSVGASIVGGFVYRGQKYAGRLGGQYIAGDFISGRIFRWQDGRRHAAGHLAGVTGFGQDDNDELYAVTLDGGLYRMHARAS